MSMCQTHEVARSRRGALTVVFVLARRAARQHPGSNLDAAAPSMSAPFRSGRVDKKGRGRPWGVVDAVHPRVPRWTRGVKRP